MNHGLTEFLGVGLAALVAHSDGLRRPVGRNDTRVIYRDVGGAAGRCRRRASALAKARMGRGTPCVRTN